MVENGLMEQQQAGLKLFLTIKVLVVLRQIQLKNEVNLLVGSWMENLSILILPFLQT